MGYILRETITINRPIVFLCGPYYQKANKSDRRNIIRKCFYENYHDNVLPLIIDDFLTEGNIKDSKVNIQLLEEIFAAISYKTYIFLDTLSAASELGLFMNHAFDNKIVAYIPKVSDVLNKKNVGYFVKDIILQMNSNQAKYYEYRPSLTRSAISTDYVVEHYGFIDDVIPENIEKDIINDSIYKGKKEKKISLEENEQYPIDESKIYYQRRDGHTFLHISISMLFYIVTSLMYEKYQSKLVSNKNATINDFDVNVIKKATKKVLVNFLLKKGIPVEEDLQIDTILQFSFEEVVYHMVTFCYVYHCFSTYKGLRLVEKHMDTILDCCVEISGNNPLKVFGISEDEFNIITQCAEIPEQFYAPFFITKGGKKREFVKYSDNEAGSIIRKIHEKIILSLRDKYVPSNKSFAYKKGGSIKKCVELHKNSDAFLKYDISKFFNSIDITTLVNNIEKVFNISSSYREITKKIIGSFYWDKKLPLGLVGSPVLSDVYMLEFDQKMIEYCKENGYIYTRYADDILISQKEEFEEHRCKILDEKLDKCLSELNLKVNHQKKKKMFLTEDGQHIKYIGVNIVHFDGGNRLSVGKQYIYDVVKAYYKYLEKAYKNNKTDEEKTELFYEERRIAGKISFIKLIEGDEGLERIQSRLGDKMELLEGDRLHFANIS